MSKMFKCLILLCILTLVTRVSYTTIAGYLARSQQVIVCYNAGYTYKCTLTSRGW